MATDWGESAEILQPIYAIRFHDGKGIQQRQIETSAKQAMKLNYTQNVPHHLPRKAGTPDADTKGAA